MAKYTVIKILSLEFECEADSPEEAEEKCIKADDRKMALFDCQYEVEEKK